MIFKAKKSVVTEGDLMMYASIVLKHLRLIILLFSFALLCGLVYYTYARPVYFSRSLVEYMVFERPVDAQKVFRDSSDRKVRKEITAPHIMRRAARRMGVEADVRTIQQKYIRKVQLRFDSERNMIVEIWPYSQQWAREFPRLLIEEYLNDREESRIEHTELTFAHFTRDMEQVREVLENNLESKFNFHDNNEMTRVTIELNQFKQLPRDILATKRRIAMMESTEEALRVPDQDVITRLSLLSSWERSKGIMERNVQINVGQVIPDDSDESTGGSGIVVVPSMISSEAKPWEHLDREHRRLRNAMNELTRAGLLWKNPRVVNQQKQIESVEAALELELETAYSRFHLEYASQQDRLRQLEAQLPEYQRILRQHEKILQDYKHFDSGQLAWSRIYTDMAKRLNTLDFILDKERVDLHYRGVIENNEWPVSPHRLKLVIYSIMFGFALSIAVPFLIEYLDSRVSDVEQVEETLRLRGLGVVPKITQSQVNTLLMEPTSREDYHLQENFRVIRTNLIMSAESTDLPQVIVVTSAMPQEGKTLVSSNLAMSFAAKNEETLLIDADLRRGRLHRVFGFNHKPGLSEILRGNCSEEDALHFTGKDQLTLLTSGKHLNNASELLDGAAFGKLIEKFRKKYKRIIIDTPPVLGLAETAIIQRHSDGVLLVIWSDCTPVRTVKAAIQNLQGTGAKFVGFILNRLDFDSLGNRYKYFYYAPNYYSNYKAIEAPPSYAEK